MESKRENKVDFIAGKGVFNRGDMHEDEKNICIFDCKYCFDVK